MKPPPAAAPTRGASPRPPKGGFWQPGTQVVAPIDYDEERERLWFYRQLGTEDASGTQLTVAWVSLDGKSTEDVATFTMPVLDPAGRPRSPRVFLAAGGKRIVVADYAEKSWLKPAVEPSAWGVDTASGATGRFPAPTATYGAAIDKAGRLLALLSSEGAEVVFLELESGKTQARVAVPRNAHGLFPGPDESRLLAFPRGLQPVVLRWPPEAGKAKLKARKVKGAALSVCPEKVAFMTGSSTAVFRLSDEYGFAAKKGVVIVRFE